VRNYRQSLRFWQKIMSRDLSIYKNISLAGKFI